MWSAPGPRFPAAARCGRRTRRGVFVSLWMVSASPMIAPTVMRGFRLAYGSWKMICMSRASARSCSLPARGDAAGPGTRPRPRSARSAAGCSARWCSCRSRFRRPRPASRRRCSSKLTPSTACTRVDRALQQAALDGEVLDEVLDLQQRAARGSRAFGLGLACHEAALQDAGHLVPGRHLAQRRRGAACRRLGHGVQRAGEAAAFGRVDQLGHGARNGLQPHLVRGRQCRCAGCCGSGPACRGGAGARRAPRRCASSTTLPAYITTTRLRHLGDHAHGVRDQHHGHAQAVLQLAASGRGSAPGW